MLVCRMFQPALRTGTDFKLRQSNFRLSSWLDDEFDAVLLRDEGLVLCLHVLHEAKQGAESAAGLHPECRIFVNTQFIPNPTNLSD